MVQMKRDAFGAYLVNRLSFLAPKVILGVFTAFKALFPLLLVIFFVPGGIERAYVAMFTIFAQVLMYVVTSYIEYSDSKGLDIPVPAERFTKVAEDDMVTVDSSRLQELLVYTSELEDWLELNGYHLKGRDEPDDVKRK